MTRDFNSTSLLRLALLAGMGMLEAPRLPSPGLLARLSMR